MSNRNNYKLPGLKKRFSLKNFDDKPSKSNVLFDPDLLIEEDDIIYLEKQRKQFF